MVSGAVEIFFKHNAVWRPGLTWKQTYLYFWSGLQVRCFSLTVLSESPQSQ